MYRNVSLAWNAEMRSGVDRLDGIPRKLRHARLSQSTGLLQEPMNLVKRVLRHVELLHDMGNNFISWRTSQGSLPGDSVEGFRESQV